MANINTNLGGTNATDGDILYADDLNDTYDQTYFGAVPVGAILPWAKTFSSADSGTTDDTTANKLVEGGQNFETTIEVGYVVWNTTDDTFAYVTAVDSDTTLSLSADIMITGEAYTIYRTPALPESYVECDGSAISDADSVFNGQNSPSLNAANVEEDYSYFLRGNIASGQTETSQNKEHNHSASGYGGTANHDQGGNYEACTNTPNSTLSITNSGGDEARPMAYTVVWIMRIK
jgi:hypothetical protein